MSKLTTSSILSVLAVTGWATIYFLTNFRYPYLVLTKTYEKTRFFREDSMYQMDGPGITTQNLGVSSTHKEQVVENANYDYPEKTEAEIVKNFREENLDLAWMRWENLTSEDKRNHVRKMMRHAWENYSKFAWGSNELKPISKVPHQGSVFGSSKTGVTIIDSLDTLYTMELFEEYNKGRDWVEKEFEVAALTAEFSVFETNIRLVGGLLSCFALTGEAFYKDKAKAIADRLLPAFDSPTGIPRSLVSFSSGSSRNYNWADSGSSILSEIGTLHLEFSYLSDVTGEIIYRNRTKIVREFLDGLVKPDGLYPNYLDPYQGKWKAHHSSIGSLGDSFYEYLLKSWIQSNKQDELARKMYEEAMQEIVKQMMQISRGGLTYFAEKKYGELVHRMEHLGCFIGGLLALGATTLQNEMSPSHLTLAQEITNTCHETYNRTFTKLGPEAFRFAPETEARALTTSEDHYILRPEVVESYFYLYRLTKDEKYRDWGWDVVEALEKFCKVEGGYTGIGDVDAEEPEQDDVQQSYFMSETLKYLYLLFSNDSVLSLDEWVFNTEAHPLPIKGVNPNYREAQLAN